MNSNQSDKIFDIVAITCLLSTRCAHLKNCRAINLKQANQIFTGIQPANVARLCLIQIEVKKNLIFIILTI